MAARTAQAALGTTIGVLAGLLLASVVVSAQTATPSSHLTWDQGGPDLPTIQAYTFRYYADGGATGNVLAAVVCTSAGTPPVVTCTVPFPAFTPGSHTLTLTAANVAGESTPSAPLAFTMIVQPSSPANVRITAK